MILRAIALLVGAYLVLWLSGEAAARACYGRRYGVVARYARIPFGLAAVTCALELVGYFVPLRVGAWLALVLPLAGAFSVWKRRRSMLRGYDKALPAAALALGLGLWPVVVAGHVALASITNHDATFYITIAERLRQVPWRVRVNWLSPGACLREIVLHNWYWRTGTASLTAGLSTWAGVDAPVGLTVLVALMIGCLPWAVLAVADAAAPAAVRGHEGIVALFGTLSAAPLFLGWQHLDGQLGAFVLFPLATGAMLAAFRHGGVRRIFGAAVWLGAALAHLADGAPMLIAFAIGGLACARLDRTILRMLATALATCAVAPVTVARAAHAAYQTYHYRVGAPAPFFPQLGWLHLSFPSAAAVVAGVHPWPPWPLGALSTLSAVAGYAGAVAGAFAAVLAVQRLQRSRAAMAAAAVIAIVIASTLFAKSSYFAGKVLLMVSAYVVPAIALGAMARWTRLARATGAVVLLADVAALVQLGRPAAWRVVDRPEHDRLVAELTRVPSGSLVVLDGFGAPTDDVLDEHRAYRAAFLRQDTVVQPGLDGMFYKPHCRDPDPTMPLPQHVYALQRADTEHLSRGRALAHFGKFTLLSIDPRSPDQVAATWAPLAGFLGAEREPDGTVFRWAGRSARAATWIAAGAPCVRLSGEARTAGATGELVMRGQEAVLYSGSVGRVWQHFETSSFLGSKLRDLDFALEHVERAPPDPAHAVALRHLAVEPDSSCASAVAIGRGDGRTSTPYPLGDSSRFDVLAASGLACGRVGVQVETDRAVELGVSAGSGAVVWQLALPGKSELAGPALRVGGGVRVQVSRRAPGDGRVDVTGFALHPLDCRGASLP